MGIISISVQTERRSKEVLLKIFLEYLKKKECNYKHIELILFVQFYVKLNNSSKWIMLMYI